MMGNDKQGESMKIGVHSGISNEEYHSGPGLSSSGLKLIDRSPLHYWARYLDPHREASEPTPALILGTAIHTAILEPDRFGEEYAIAPVVDRRTKDGKAEWQAFLDDCAVNKKTAITKDDYDTCARISRAVVAHPLFATFFAKGAAEQSVYWKDPETGVLCKCRPDWMVAGAPVMLDVKSTQDASPSAFAKSIFKYGYHISAAWYLEGWRQATGENIDQFIFAAFEKDAPNALAFYQADEAMLQIGRQECQRLLTIYADCLNSNTWPGYEPSVTPLSLPPWVMKAANDNEEIEEIAYV
jgi:exodeoxyribonuclease VIII